jgi:hypothetical protein
MRATVLDLASAAQHVHRNDGDSIPIKTVNHRGTSAAHGMRKLMDDRPVRTSEPTCGRLRGSFRTRLRTGTKLYDGARKRRDVPGFAEP